MRKLCLLFALMLLFPLLALAQQNDLTRLLRFPDVHTDKVVFVYAGDIWIQEWTLTDPAPRLRSAPANHPPRPNHSQSLDAECLAAQTSPPFVVCNSALTAGSFAAPAGLPAPAHPLPPAQIAPVEIAPKIAVGTFL